MIIRMTVKDLFELMKTLNPGERIDIAQNLSASEDDGEQWGGIMCIDASVFDEEKAWILDYYGGGIPGIIAYRDDDEGDDYGPLELEAYLHSNDFLQLTDHTVIVDAEEIKTVKPIIRREGEKE